MTVTEYGYCPHCDVDHVELTMTTAGVLSCHKCGSVDVYDSKEEYERLDEYLLEADEEVTAS